MPLAFGYQAGGDFKPGFYNGRFISIRKKLIRNLLISQIILLIGLSYAPLSTFFSTLMQEGIRNRIALTSIYATMFLVTPVYLLGQTIPLISNYFSKEELSRITGKMLFLSTVGSFIGAVFSTLVLMSYIGVHYTAVVNFFILAILVTLLSKKRRSEIVLASWILAIIGLTMNSNAVMQSLDIVENNKYNTVMIKTQYDRRHMILNNNSSSMMTEDGRRHKYIEFMERVGILPIWRSDPPKNILVIGAGGFTIGHPDHNNHYDFVDIDAGLLELAETHILKEKLSPNKAFHPMPARSYLSLTDKKYDLIIIDAYLGNMSIPEQLVTQEFFQQVKDALNDGGVVMANMAVSTSFSNAFSRNIDNTFRSVFPHISRHSLNKNYNLWSDDEFNDTNAIYIYKDQPHAKKGHVYTDNKNTIFMDKPQKRYDPTRSKKEQKDEYYGL